MAEKAVATRFGSVKAARSALKGSRSNSALRRLKPDETVKVRFLEEPDDWFEAHYHWLGANFLWCSQERSCAGCKAGDRPKTIVLANAVIFSSDDDREQNKVVVMQMAPTLANTLLKFHEKRGTLLDRDYDLTREGSSQTDTVYSADPDDPKARKMSRFENGLHDIEAIITAEIGGGDEEEDDEDEPRSSSKKPVKKSSKRRDEDDEYEDDDESDEEEERPRSSSRAVAKKKKPSRSSHEDEDEEEDGEDERPAKSKKSKGDGLNEFKSKKPGTASKPRAVVRRAR